MKRLPLRRAGGGPPSILRDVLLAVGLWIPSLLLLLLAEAEGEIVVYWGVLALSGMLLHGLAAYYLVPPALVRRRPFGSYLWRYLLLLLATVLPVLQLMRLLMRDNDQAVGFTLFYFGFHLLVTGPLTWVLLRRRRRREQALEGLQQELGHSTASLDLLRAQINPHFLFNALNTLYGTALQENAERTAQGIQMLGDMMRFMLHENHQPRILLAREIEYLRNFIALQSLRIATSPGITLDTSIEEAPAGAAIAPMLLIPFVENAFKHGISLQHKSWIRVSLHCAHNTLYFDVYNSRHERPTRGLENDSSGIGLANAQQRLQLLYPGRHELVIRQTPQEYFVHLTVQL
ncbi:sensor histidine kinase [Hymenobacter coalescens]